jgi:type II secretory pathway pseudopilin PulG
MTRTTRTSPTRREATGFTLIEAVMSILIVGLMLVAALNTVGASKVSRVRNAEQSLGPMLAQELMTEILNQNYMEPAGTLAFGLEGEDPTVRTDWDDVDDYHGWSASPPQNRDGTVVSGTEGWGRSVAVSWADTADLNSTAGSPSGIKRIDVTVTRNGRTVTTLSSLRTSGWPEKSPTINVLFIVDNPSSLTSQAQYRKTWVESWGYVVELISASDTQSAFDAAVARNHVAFISEEINSNNLGTKLVDTQIGVVCEEPYLMDEFGFTDSYQLYSKSKINIVDNSHFITEVFATGDLTILTSDSEFYSVTGGLGGGVDVLALRVGKTEQAMVVIETGGGLFGGGIAAGRRVQLPWGGDNFNGNLLNDDGKTLMKRAIAWAASRETALDVP